MNKRKRGKCLNTFQSIQYRMSASPGRMLFGERYVMQDAVDRKKMGVKEEKNRDEQNG